MAIGRTSTSILCTRQRPSISRQKINDAEMAAPEPRHDSWLAVDRSAFRVDAWQTDKILAGKQQVLMPKDQRVNTVELGEILARILLSPG